MNSDASKLNIQDLQIRVIHLLEQVSALMTRASTQLWFKDDSFKDKPKNKYEIYKQDVEKERRKVENLELRMAIAAPMNTGKSTIINAIIGEELLPSPATAMTTLPTEIVFKANAVKPVLKLTSGIQSAFKLAVLALKQKIDEQGINQVMNQIAEYPHLKDLLNKIHALEAFSVLPEITGCDEINNLLTDLNHIIRLCSILELSEDTLQSLNDTDVPRIETPFFQFQSNQQSEKLGNLVIVDTPGPNEAGVSIKLESVVSKQLANSQLVLIVLDFTQLKAQQAEKIKEEVQKVIRTRGKQNLYVLINKVDQRRKGDMNTEQVQGFVTKNLELVDVNNTDRVFEISARQAFCSNDFLRESQQRSDLKGSEIAQALAQEIWSVDWEDELKEATVEEIQRKARKLWQKSGFAVFLEKAINVILEQVAPRCMESALNLCLVHLEGLSESIQSRKSYIASDAKLLEKAISDLNEELFSLVDCRKSLDGEVAKTKKQINTIVNGNLKKLKKEVRKKLDALPISLAMGSLQKTFSNFINNIQNRETGEFEFENKEDAKSFADKIVAHTRQIIVEQLKIVSKDIEKQTQKIIKELSNLLEDKTNPIIKRAQSRLNRDFNVNFNAVPLRTDVYMRINNPEAEFGGYGLSNFFKVFLKGLSDNLFLALGIGLIALISNNFIGKAIISGVTNVAGWLGFSLDIMNEKYNIKLDSFSGEVASLFDQKVTEIEKSSNKFIGEYFEQQTKIYFDALDSILSEYRNDLEQSLEDKYLPLTKLEELKQALDSFADGTDRAEVEKLIEQIKVLSESIKQFLPQQ